MSSRDGDCAHRARSRRGSPLLGLPVRECTYRRETPFRMVDELAEVVMRNLIERDSGLDALD